jgi:NADH-quinone oxidoreductase subunit N
LEQIRLYSSDLVYLLPEITLVVAAIILSIIDLFLPKSVNRNIIGWLSLIGIAASMILVVMNLNPDKAVQLLNESYRIDDFSNIMKLILLAGTGLIILMSLSYLKEKNTLHLGEYYYFLLPTVLGGMIMSSSGDLITLFVGLELLSISSYILVAMNKKDTKSNESAIKYLVMGGVSSAIILYGMSFLYGISGSTNLTMISQAISIQYENFSAFIYISFFLIIAGLGFKIAVAPFHTWAADVYQGALTPVTAFLAVVSKTAAFAILFRIVYNVYPLFKIEELANDIMLSLSVLAATAMIVGNVLAFKQRNMKRLLAYSGVANAGYLLVPIANFFSGVHYANYSEFIFYLIAYVVMNIGVFAVFMMLERTNGIEDISTFSGLYYRAPITSIAMTILLLSLAGLPVTGGFFGKFYILIGTLQGQNYWLAAVMIATSIISYYYYFGIIKQMFFRADFDSSPVKFSYTLGVIIWVCSIVTVFMGIYPQFILNYIHQIFTIVGDLLIM